ncbi:Intraflagellar transport protein osm-1 [Intoshia linei]|uniref:Intraflagellar transport protein osm-1 n=1 Tax=Intoshia linei TaxID=1819745 RepID=A0A177BAX6_9BILA|nr:Intraflagellar transport protein osm-1 [Intoshia linei]
MMLKYYNNIIPAKDQICEIQALAWSSNCKKMAVATGDLVISLFSETCEQKDKFATKPCDSKYPKNSYIITGIAFSFDGQKLAVAQSDNIIFVYKIGENWGDKKVICNKFFQQTAVTCLIWPKNQEILFGAYDGKVRIANTLTNKSSTLYNSESFVVSMSANVHGTSIISGHADCKVVRCHLQKSEDISSSQGCVFVHSCSPYVLIHTNQKGTIIAAGCDKRIVAYSEDGTPIQTFDYSKQVGKLSNSGQTFVVGSYNRIRLFTWSSRRGMWNEEIEKYIENLYTISALVWKPDDSKIIIGTLCGAVEVIDCCLKRLNYRNKLEITYVGVTQVLVQPIGLNKVGDANDRIIIKSRYESAIDDIKPCPGERYIVAHTSETLIVVDIVLKRLLEVPWLNADDEKYIYHNDAVFMVYTSGELILLEFNKEEILGSVRTEFLHHDLLSIRINEKRMLVNDSAVKIMGYMVDKTTFAIIDLVDNNTVTQYEHSSKIRWLVINETCRYVLFLDKMLHLNLYKIPYDEVKDVKGSVFSDTLIFPLLNYCSWVNWVKGSDVIVAQTHASICIWYNIDTPDHYVTIPIKGDVVELKYSENNVVSVITSSGPTQQDTHSYPLDDGLVEFGTAIEDSDLNRAVRFLEAKENNKEKTLTQNTLQSFTPLWRKLAELSLKNGQLFITWRCYSALEDWPRADFLFETICLSLKNYGELNMNDYKIKARVALFDNNLKLTEQIYLENNNVDGIIDLYLKMDKWTEAIDIAKFKSHPRLETLQKDYYNWLVANNQKDKAGDLLSKFGDLKGALNLFMKANRPSRAAMILMQNLQMLDEDQSLLDRLCSALIKSECYQRAGELLEKCDRASEAMSCYKKGKIFRRAIELCRKIEPENVTKMEEKWGDHLFTEKQYDEAINHYIEAGNSFKAVESSIKAKQWNKSLSIIQINKDYKNSKTHFLLLANYFQSIQEFDTAEKLYLDIGDALNVVKMYQESERWSDAHRIASSYMEKNELIEMYSKQAELMENSEKYKEAENLYVEMEQPAKAIIMYKKRNMYKEMVRLVKQYFPDKYVDTQKHLAKDYERSGRLLEAEKLLIEVSDWPNAIKMYRNKNRWEDAYRISKEHAPINAQAKVAYAWAKAVGSSTAKKLLDHYDCLEIAINHACTNK